MERIDLLIKEIEKSAQKYANNLEENCYLYVYQNKCFEVYFAKDCFRHLTGVNSTVHAKEFYELAKSQRLNKDVIKLKHGDMRTCLKKSKHLPDLYRLTITDTVVIEDVRTKYMEFELGVTNLKLTLLLHENSILKDNQGSIISNIYIPSSFRVDGDEMKLSRRYETIDCVFEKKFGEVDYSKIVFQDDRFNIRALPDNIKEKISKEFMQEVIEFEDIMKELADEEDLENEPIRFNITMESEEQLEAIIAVCEEKRLTVERGEECNLVVDKKYVMEVGKIAKDVKNDLVFVPKKRNIE